MDWKNVQYKDGKYKTAEGGSGGSSTFAGLDDVDFSNVQNGQVPKYNSATQKWENADESGGEGTVTDVKVDGQSVVDPQTGEANITMPTPPTIPVVDVEVNGVSVVDSNKKAQITSYKEVTQAEYNALPSSKLNDGVLYAIKDVGGADSMPPIIYSDEEREVGVWRDGKPLYQKTITYNCADSSNAQTIYTIPSTHDIVHVVDAYFKNSLEQQIRYTWYKDHFWSYIILGGQYNTITVHRETNDANWQSGIKFVITIQYTKTTDVPGSGIWNQQGCYAHHYSGIEQIIGTWYGKTLWEKTIQYTSAGGDVDSDVIIDTSIKHGLNCNVVDVQGVQTYGYRANDMPNDTSDPEPISQSSLYLPYYGMNTISPGHIYFYSDGVHFMKKCASSEANSIILTVRYVKK